MLSINTVHLGDCLELMKEIPNKKVDLIITSPPYNMGDNTLGGTKLSSCGQKHYVKATDNKMDFQYIGWLNSVIRESLRVSRYVFWNIQFIRSTRGHILSIQNEFRNNLKDIFIWKKQSVANITAKSGGMAKGWEYIFLFGDNNISTFEYNNFPENGYVPNIQEWFKTEYFKEHHATFPLALPSYFIKYFTKENDLILDPFMGTGTTAVAALKNNRRFIGIEKEPAYVKIANNQISGTSVFPPEITNLFKEF